MTPTHRRALVTASTCRLHWIPTCRVFVATACAALLAVPLRAEIVSFTGQASTQLTQIVSGVAGDPLVDSAQDPNDPLPLQVVSQTLADTQDAAGSVAGQFSDPTTSGQANPQEFAASLALSSQSTSTRYTGTTTLEEVRSIVFSPSEVNGLANGATAHLSGSVYLDAVMAVLSQTKGGSLTNVDVTLHAHVVRRPAGATSSDPNALVVFDGSLSYRGASNGSATTATTGSFPNGVAFATDLGALVPEFGNVNVLVLPQVHANYNYTAVVGEPFELVATVELTGENQPGGTAVIGLLGTPLASLVDVITATNGATTAQLLQAKLLQERAQPTGQLVLNDCGCTTGQGLSPCMLTGLTSVFGLTAARGWARGRRRR